MSTYVFKLPDLGEGTVAAEIVAWRVAVGDQVAEDTPLVEMSTDKAVVEVPSPVAGRIVSLAGKPGDTVAVGAELLVIETAPAGAATSVTGGAVGPNAAAGAQVASSAPSVASAETAADAHTATAAK
ncbi:MAG: biotin/lipoyl-containing protein, partial [Gammaproteobacteria bacterium]|nr:biotin/lipoyl-containing protein [Gammaproteobacteria bacterium]